MAVRDTALVVIFVWCLSLRSTGADDIKGEDAESDVITNLDKKPPDTTIRTKYGDVYNCVEFHKQPAFDHPLYKNLTFSLDQIKPPSYQTEEVNKGKKNVGSMSEQKAKDMWVNGEGCPRGTVPIKKHTADELKNATLASELYGSKVNIQSVQNPGVHYAIVRTKAPGPYYGGGMSSSTYNPHVAGSQYSAARLKLQNGPESIEVGWMVNPSLYGDTRTRLYVYTNAGKSHCFNTHCPGIISVRPDLPLDFVLQPTSTTGSKGQRFIEQFFIYKDQANGNWFLELGSQGNVIGFWPQSAFTTLANSANYVEWGGVVSSPPNVPSPPMGSGGSKLYQDTKQDAYCKFLTFINKDHKLVDASDTEPYADIATYHVKDIGYVNVHFRHLMFFGGYGGYTGN